MSTRTMCGFCEEGVQEVSVPGTDEVQERDCWHCDGTGFPITPEQRARMRDVDETRSRPVRSSA